MLHAYQTEKLHDLHEALSRKENAAGLLDEILRRADFIPWFSGTADTALGKGTAESVVVQHHLWLMLTELPNRQAC